MKNIIILLIASTLLSCKSTPVKNTNQKPTEIKKDAQGNLIGVVNKEAFNQAPYNTWFTSYYNAYKVDEKVIAEIEKNIKGITIKAFMGTWCSDSKRETPKMYQLLEKINFDVNNFEIVAVNRSKKTPDNLQANLNIIRVPTFIFYKNGKEIGRFVEHPRETLEKDILKIVSGKPYKHAYEN